MGRWLCSLCLVLFLSFVSFVPNRCEDVLAALESPNIASLDSDPSDDTQADFRSETVESQPDDPLQLVPADNGEPPKLSSELTQNVLKKSNDSKDNIVKEYHSIAQDSLTDPSENTDLTGTNVVNSKESKFGLISDKTDADSMVAEKTKSSLGHKGILNVLSNLGDSKIKNDLEDTQNANGRLDGFGALFNPSNMNRPGVPAETIASNNIHSQQNDEPSEQVVPDYVDIKLSKPDVVMKDEVKPDDVSNTGTSVDPGLKENSFQDDSTDDSFRDDTDRTYGNPPVLSDSDMVKLAEAIPDNLSPEEREKLRQNISDSLGLSALGPGLAMLPNVMNPSEQGAEQQSADSKSSSTQSYVTSTSTSNSELSQDKAEVNRTGYSLNDISNAVPKDTEGNMDRNSNDDADEDNVDYEKDDEENEGYRQEENYHRKVLNNMEEDETEEADDDPEKDDKDYDDYYYNDEYDNTKDYTGGEVHNSAPKVPSKEEDRNDADASDDFGQTNDKLADAGEETDQDSPDGEDERDEEIFSYNQDFEDENNDDWYYNPEGDSERDKLGPSTYASSSSSTPTEDTQNKSPSSLYGDEDKQEDAEKESVAQINAPDFKEGVISMDDVHAKKPLQAPKRTIVLYTVLIVIFISGIVVFSVLKNPFKQNSRSTHHTPVIRIGEEGKRLLDHPFV